MKQLLFGITGVVVLVAATLVTVQADGPPSPPPPPGAKGIEVPNLFGARLAQANAIVRKRGLRLGQIYEISKERMYAYLKAHVPKVRDAAAYVRGFRRGKVFSQLPQGGVLLPAGSQVDVVLITRNDAKIPPHPYFTDLEVLALPAAARDLDDAAAAAERKLKLRPSQPAPAPAPAPAPGAVSPKAVVPPARRTGPPAVAEPAVPAGRTPSAVDVDPTAPSVRPTPPANAAVAEGSPEAPRAATSLDRTRVPTLVGLDIVDAETLARDVGLTLYVDRVAGHPSGRVLEQVPAGGGPRPPGNVVKLRVTAGGDFEAATPAAPAVYVEHVHVPDVLDRTDLQARRILEAVGLAVVEQPAKHGMPGRVVDQAPALGLKVPKGSIVVIKIGPGKRPGPLKGPPAPAASGTGVAPRDPEGAVPVVSGDGNIPRAVAPTASTRLPADTTIPMGFSWSKVAGATAYVLEVEEQTASGAWMQNARKPVHSTAATLDLARLDIRAKRAFRWRVRAVFEAKQGRPSAWIVLR